MCTKLNHISFILTFQYFLSIFFQIIKNQRQAALNVSTFSHTSSTISKYSKTSYAHTILSNKNKCSYKYRPH